MRYSKDSSVYSQLGLDALISKAVDAAVSSREEVGRFSNQITFYLDEREIKLVTGTCSPSLSFRRVMQSLLDRKLNMSDFEFHLGTHETLCETIENYHYSAEMASLCTDNKARIIIKIGKRLIENISMVNASKPIVLSKKEHEGLTEEIEEMASIPALQLMNSDRPWFIVYIPTNPKEGAPLWSLEKPCGDMGGYIEILRTPVSCHRIVLSSSEEGQRILRGIK